MTRTVSWRIVAGFSFVLGLVVLLAIVAVVALRGAVRAYGAALTQRESVLEIAFVAEAQVQEANLSYLRYMLDGQTSFIAASDSATRAAQASLEQVRDSTDLPETRALWTEALNRLADWASAVDSSSVAVRAGQFEQGKAIWRDRAYPAWVNTRQAIQAGVTATRDRTARLTVDAQRAADRMEEVLLVTAVLALVVGAASAWLLNRAVSAPLRETTGVLASSAAEILAATTQQAAGATETSAAVVQTSTTVDEVA
ncbi:MAG TPA: hypothetical protein VFL95_00350, partial [Gemmatimonadales bacterium]|nr:hypothetical protein [Gemmatimonadales bacterium]